jgi:hypothetical protein
MLTRAEYENVFLNLRDKMIIIPPECIIVRLKDVLRIIESFTERDENAGQKNTSVSTK